MFSFLRNRRRKALRARSFSQGESAFLEEAVPYYRLLEEADRVALCGHMQVLLHEKHFEAVAGLALTNEMKLLICAQAAIPLLGRDMEYYPRLKSVVVYPETFSAPVQRHSPGGIVTEEDLRRVGESWQWGAVLLSWRRVLQDTRLQSGSNVIIHEFAHQIDQADGLADGWPEALGGSQEANWAEIMTREYAALREALAEGATSVLDPYGATKPTEFFATLSETFFIRPGLLYTHHPALYGILRDFYAQDPMKRFPPE